MSRQKRHGKINIRYHDLKQQYSRATDEERARLEEEMNNLNLRYFTGNKALDITLTQNRHSAGRQVFNWSARQTAAVWRI